MNRLPERARAFVALGMSEEIIAAIDAFIGRLRGAEQSREVRWTRGENLHLTLRFLGGQVTAPALEAIDTALAEIARTSARFEVHACGIGAFPERAPPRVFWIGLDGGGLQALAEQTERAAVGAGLASEPRAYAAHLTIGRARDRAGSAVIRGILDTEAEHDFGVSTADSLILYRSVRGHEGVAYDALARYRFGAG
jgi:RNA 2',3'-cyclic 3'-phosphodiesterase